MNFLRLIFGIFDVFSKAHSIKEDEVARNRSVHFAVTGIVYSLLTVVFALVGSYLITLSEAGLLYIFLLVIGVVLLVGVLVSFIGALMRVIAQLTINRKPMSWIALAVLILSVIACIIIFVKILG